MTLTIALAAAGAAAWIYLLAARGRFWLVRLPEKAPSMTGSPRVVVVIPARDEAESIGRTVTALLGQRFAGDLSIVLVDDHSSDGTADLATKAAGTAHDRLTVLSAAALPPGWTGKLWALSQGLDHALPGAPDYVLLTDADIVHDPDNVAAQIARAQQGGHDLVSQMVLLRNRSAAERALIPAFVFFFFMLYPPRWILDRRNNCSGAAGGSILIRPAALARIGGIASIRDALIDDCSLAQRVKASGGSIRLDPTRDAHSIRDYGSAGEIWPMIARTAFTQLRYSSLLLLGTLAGLAITYLAPPLLALFGHGWPRLLGAGAWLAMAVAFQPTLRLYRQSPLWGLALPAIALFYAAATLGSAVAYWRGKGGRWKGRVQAVGPG